MTDTVESWYEVKPPRKRPDPLSIKELAKKDLAKKLAPCTSFPEDYEEISRGESSPVQLECGALSCKSADIPPGKSVWVDFYPSEIFVSSPAGHVSNFPLFRNGGRALRPNASKLEKQWSRWRAGIEYCLRKKWSHDEIGANDGSYRASLVSRINKDGLVWVVTASFGGETNVDVYHLVEDLSYQKLVKFPDDSMADFVELYIFFSDFKEQSAGGFFAASGGGGNRGIIIPCEWLYEKDCEEPEASEIEDAVAALEESRTHADVNPQALVFSLTELAHLRMHQRNTIDAVSLYKEAIAAFAAIPLFPIKSKAPHSEVDLDSDEEFEEAEEEDPWQWQQATSDACDRIWRAIESAVIMITPEDFSILSEMAIEVFAKSRFSEGKLRNDIEHVRRIAGNFEMAGRKRQAIQFLSMALQKWKQYWPDDSFGLQTLGTELVRLCEEDEDFETAEALILELIEESENKPDQEEHYLMNLLGLAEIYRNQYKYQDALDTLSRAHADYLKMNKPLGFYAGNLGYSLLELERLKDVDDLIRHAYLVQTKCRFRTSLSSIGATVSRLIKAYIDKEMFAEAESILLIARTEDAEDGYPRKWNYTEADLFLHFARHAKQIGDDTTYLRLLGRSISAFDDFIDWFETSPGPKTYLSKHKQDREKALQESGFDAAELAAAAEIMVPYDEYL